MRISVLLGTALIVAGGTVFLRELSAPAHYVELKLGDASVSGQDRNPIIPWVTGLAVLAGLTLVTIGTRRRVL